MCKWQLWHYWSRPQVEVVTSCWVTTFQATNTRLQKYLSPPKLVPSLPSVSSMFCGICLYPYMSCQPSFPPDLLSLSHSYVTIDYARTFVRLIVCVCVSRRRWLLCCTVRLSDRCTDWLSQFFVESTISIPWMLFTQKLPYYLKQSRN